MSYITIHPEKGVNPSVSVCYFCGENKNELFLLGYNKGKEAPREAVFNTEPCDKCKEHMKKGVIFISVRDGEYGTEPYRTGKFAVVKEEGVRRIVKPKSLAEEAIKKRVCFIEDSAWKKIGLD